MVESLDESDLLSDLFEDPAKETLHIAVKFSPIGGRAAVDLTGKMTYVACTSAAADVVRPLPLPSPGLRADDLFVLVPQPASGPVSCCWSLICLTR
jgi:hypothetical protein